MTRLTVSALSAVAMAAAVAVPNVAATSAYAQGSPRLSESYVLRVNSRGPYCAYINAKKANPISFALENRIRREACFPTVSQCRNWLYWAQTYFGDVRLTRRCG